jgi:hypothetical protein
MQESARPGSRREGTHPRASGAPLIVPAGGEFRARSRSVELAAELLDVINESELEGFLGRLVAETTRKAGGRIPAGTGRVLVAVLSKTAERTLPTLTGALGDGTEPAAAAGLSAAETAARVYGMELEGMSAEDRDYEIARQFVRFAQAATARVAIAPAPAPVVSVVDAAVAGAGREFAPGLLPPEHGPPMGSRPGPGGQEKNRRPAQRGAAAQLVETNQ